MQTVEIKKENAQRAYNAADCAGKKMLEDLFGRDQLSVHGMHVTSFEQACEITGDSNSLPFLTPVNNDQEAINYLYQMRVIARAINPYGWQPDYTDGKQKKWEPYMEYVGSVSAFRFCYSVYGYTRACAGAGVRLASQELCDYLGKKFAPLISKYLLTKQ